MEKSVLNNIENALEEIRPFLKNDGGDTKKFMARAKDKNDPFRLMGFGHRVYKNFDPRAKIIKKTADLVLKELGINDPILNIAKKYVLSFFFFRENKSLIFEYFFREPDP